MWGDREYYKGEIALLVKQYPNKTAKELFDLKPQHIRLSRGTFGVYLSEARKEGIAIQKQQQILNKNQTLLINALTEVDEIDTVALARLFNINRNTMAARLKKLKARKLVNSRMVNGVNRWSIIKNG